MGICKCRKSTGLFCFVHRKAVCRTCIVDHYTCTVKTYVEWLKDGDYTPTSCGLCHSTLENDAVRLICLHLFHKSCLDTHCEQSYPPHTALAGYGCPTCAKSIAPSISDSSQLATMLRKILSSSPWAVQAGFVESVSIDHSAAENLSSISSAGHRRGGLDSENVIQRTSHRDGPSGPEGSTGLDGQVAVTINQKSQPQDEEEDKYHSRDVSYACGMMGLLPTHQKGRVKGGSSSAPRSGLSMILISLIIICMMTMGLIVVYSRILPTPK